MQSTFFALQSLSAEVIQITEPEGKIVLGIHTEYFEDKDGKLALSDIQKMEDGWKKSEQKNLNFGFSTSAYWLKFQIENKQEKYREWLLEISYPFLDRIDLYSPDKDGNYSVETTGDTFPFSNRKIPNRHFILKVPLYKEKIYTYYLRIESKGGANIYPAILFSPIRMVEKEHQEIIILGVFYGILVSLLLYNLFLFIALKDISYFYYLSYLFNSTLFFLGINGLGQEYIWSEWVWFNSYVFPLSETFVIISMLLFVSNYLTTKKNTPFLHKLINLFLYFCIIFLVAIFLLAMKLQ